MTWMSDNGLSGSIPVELGGLSNLSDLDLSDNGLSGLISTQLGDLTSLIRLNLSHNRLSGSIPVELGGLSNLSDLDLSDNGLSGSIPVELGGLSNLSDLDLSDNGLSGSIPAELGNLTSLIRLDLSGNGLSGSIPAELGSLISLTGLKLYSNDLSGSIPAELGSLISLTGLNLHSNDLSGSIPAELGNLTNLTYLWLRWNSLSGSIPAELGNLISLTDLDLSGNGLSGSIPAELGNLTSLTDLDLSGNGLSGSIPAELGNLISLTGLDLYSNDLSGSIPAELGNLTNLTSLWLGFNGLSGCVPLVLSTVRHIFFDSTIGYCDVADVTPTRSWANESDGAVVFVLSVDPPSGPGSDGSAAAMVDYATVPGTAQAGTDFVATSGTVTIPTGNRYATVSVPLVNDSVVESEESFTLLLSNPVAAELTTASVSGAIVDDDSGSRTPVLGVGRCLDATVGSSVSDVYDVSQAGFAQWHQVFVDIDLDCGGRLTSGVGYPTAARVIHGPASSIGLSDRCLTQYGTGTYRTASRAASTACPTFAPPGVSQLSQSGRSTHLLQIPDTAIGEDHQIQVWVDYDGDGVDDGGEPYDIFESNFVARQLPESEAPVFEYPRDFELQLVEGSTRVARAGLNKETQIRLVEATQEFVHRPGSEPLPITVYTPVAGFAVGAVVASGPSTGQPVMCFDTPRSTPRPPSDRSACVTDDWGEVVVRYQVPVDAAEVFSMRQDLLRVFIDADRDNELDIGPFFYPLEPVAYLTVPIARAINYVALGDSYSSGENGEDAAPGAYQTGVSPADGECRRWDQAYPYVFAHEVLGYEQPSINVTFATFACTGAETVNIHDPLDPNPTPAPPALAHITDRPSSKAVRGEPEYEQEPRQAPVLVAPRHRRWEPRQATSLQETQTERAAAMRDVDMITITIGGNDAGFADVLQKCVRRSGCSDSNTNPDFVEIGNRVAAVITELRSIAPEASIIVLGYPYLTPDVGVCVDPQEIFVPDSGQPFSYSEKGTWILMDDSDECRASFSRINDCSALSAVEIFDRSLGGVGAVIQFASDFVDRISFSEARFLWEQASELNERIREAAARSGAHFVDVVGGVAGAEGFVGHSPCAGSDAWLDGFEAKPGISLGLATSPRSFHPNVAGHQGYSDVLQQFIRNAVSTTGVALNEAGLPVNPTPRDRMSRVRSTVGSAVSKPGSSVTEQSSDTVATRDSETPDRAPEPSSDYLLAQRVVEATECGVPFVSPGEQLRLVTGGFAADSSVSFTVRAESFGGTELTAPMIPSVTADADGVIDVLWTVPTAPAASVDAAPRVFWVEASGVNADGGVHSAVPLAPLVAYPATVPCATADTAATTLGEAVEVSVLGNDTAPTGGSWDVSSVRILGTSDEGFTVDQMTGVVSYTPPHGFYGTAVGSYVVYDTWRVGVRADVTVTVASGCTITGVAGVVEITGTEGDDVICVPDPDNRQAFYVIYGLGGDDIIIGGDGTEWIYGGEGADTIYGGGSDDRIVGGADVDTVHGGVGMDRVYSLDLDDMVVDDDYEMKVTPQRSATVGGPVSSDDWVWVDVSGVVVVDVLGNDHDPDDNLDVLSLTITRPPTLGTAAVVTAGDGRRVVEYTAPGVGGTATFGYRVCDTLNSCTAGEVTVMVGTTGCTVVGTDASETLYGTAGDDVICALGGDDVVYGLGGDDIIVGGDGNDILFGGDATLIGASDGDDLIWGGAGEDSLYGGNGKDTLFGGVGDDTLAGNRRDDRLYGGDGDDTIVGGGENDVIYGGAGDDTLDGHAHDDMIFGGPGVDMVRGGNGDDILYGNQGNDTLIGNAGADTLYGGSGDDGLDGSTQNDLLWGGTGDDTLNGRGHDDQLHGGPGDDTLNGGASDDRIYGGTGDDTLDGGNGTDHLDGGGDTDSCRRAASTTSCETEVRL